MRYQPLTIRCWRCGAATRKCATSKISPTSWSIRKERSTAAITGRRPATASSSARSCMSSMPSQTRRASAARELLNKSDNERSGVLSTAMSFLGLYRDPVVAKVTDRCDWRIADLIAQPRPLSLYLVVPPSDINRTKPLIRLILNQIGRRLTEELNAKDRRHRLL